MDYFGGNKDNILPFGPVPWTDTLGETAGGGSIGGQYAADAMAIGSVTPTLTWVPAAGKTLQTDPPSEPVYILETASAFWSTTYEPLPWTGGDASDGLGDSAVAVDLIYGAGQTSSGTHLVQKDGSSGIIKLDPVWMDADTPTYTSSSIWGYAQAGCSLSVQPFNATLTLPGTTQDTDGSDNILIGQGCMGSFTGDEPELTLSNFQWDAGGAVFDQFQVAPDQSWGHATPVTSDQWQQPNPHWHYLQYDGRSFTVTCSATANINGAAVGTIRGQRKVRVWAPYYYLGANVGPCTIVGDIVQAGGVDIETQPGIKFTGRVGTPALFKLPSTGSGMPGSSGNGTWAFLQLCNLNEAVYSSVVLPSQLTTDGYELDNGWPYFGQYDANSTDANPAPVSAPDSPVVGFNATADKFLISDDFQMYMMYLPPGSASQWVPLDKLPWHWDVNSSELGGQWVPTPPGTVIADPDQRWMVHPEWTKIHINSVTHL